MPRALDLKQPTPDYDPTRSGTEFHFADLFMDLAELIQSIIDGMLDNLAPLIIAAIEELTGIDLSAIKPLLDELHLDLSSPEAFFMSLINALTVLPAVLVALLESLISGGLLGGDSPLNALNLFNLVPTSLLGMLDVSHIGTTNTNLITDGDFLDGTPIEGWIHDLTGGFGGTGSRTVTADGTTHELLGNLIPVSKDQVVPLKGKAKWSGLTGTGNPVQLAVTGYDDAGAATDQQTVASHSTTPPNTDWVDLSGSYTVPANVSALRSRLVVGSGATAGQVSFSKIGATKTGPLLQRLISGTDPGTFLPDDIENLFGGIITNALELLTKASQGDFEGLVSTIEGDVQEGFEEIGSVLGSFLNGFSPLNGDNIASGSVLDDFIPGIGTIHDSIVTAVGNLDGSGFDIIKMFEVLTGQTQSVVDANAGVTAMFARLSNLESKVSALPVAGGGTGQGTADGGAIGVTDTDNMERASSSGLGPLWLTTYTAPAGTWATFNGHDAEWLSSLGGGDADFLCIRNNPAILRSQTDYQRVTMDLSSKATRYWDSIFGTFNYTGHDDIWLRISDDTTSLANVTGIRIRYSGDGRLSITRFVAGAPTTLKSLGVGGINPPGPGANLIGEAGVLADGATRTFRAKIGASIRLQVSETGSASGLGGAFRRWGHGGRADGHLLPLPGQQKPGGIHGWNGMDQTL